MKPCKYVSTCMQTLVWAWLAFYGGREIQLPNCDHCNLYLPEGEGGDVGRG